MNAGAQWIVFEHWFSYTIPLTHFKGIIKASSGICVLTSISIFSNLVECVDFSDLSSATEGWFISFFRINNIKLKSSFVRCRKYHKSRWNCAAELQITVDLLCGTTAAKLHYSVDLSCGTTAAELHNSVDLIYFVWQTAAELHNSVDLLCGTTPAVS